MIGGICQANAGGGFVSSILDYVDCQAQAIGLGGYQALATPGSTLSLVLSALLTIFIALFGYRMLFGEAPALRDGVLAAVKVGIVLTLALSWPVYRTLVYDVALKAPAELASDIARPAGLPGASGGLVTRLDYADRAFVTLSVLGTGIAPIAPVAPQAEAAQRAPSLFDPFAMGGARIVYLTGAVGALAAMRLIAGIMLALGPFFVAFLLFEGTRGLFEGWIRVLAGSALGALGTAIVLGVELALIEPRLAELIAWRTAGYAVPGAPVELFVISLVFAFVNLAVLIAAWRLTVGFGLPATWRALPARLVDLGRGQDIRVPAVERDRLVGGGTDRSRAASIADAVVTTQRRDALREGIGSATAPRRAEPHGERQEPGEVRHTPLGQGARRTRSRISASAARRDSTT